MALQYNNAARRQAISTDPGRLDRRVTLQYPVQSRDANGAAIVEWNNAADVWASKREQTGQRAFAAEEKQALDLVTFRIRWRSDLAPFWRLTHGDNVFEIIPPLAELGRHQFLDLTCRGVNQRIPSAAQNVLQLEGSSSNSYLQLEDGSALLLEAAA